jgi:hypothetical protein
MAAESTFGVIPGGGKNGRTGKSYKSMEEAGEKTSPMALRELPRPRANSSKYQKPTSKRGSGRGSMGRSSGR